MSDTTPMEKLERDFGALFSSQLGRDVLQQICEMGHVYDAPPLEPHELAIRHGARALALDIAILAGALPEVPGSGGRAEPDRPETALTAGPPPEGDSADSAVT